MDPVKTATLWINAINPQTFEKTIEEQKNKGTLMGEGIRNIAIITVISTVINLIAGGASLIVNGILNAALFGLEFIAIQLGVILISSVLNAIFIILLYLVSQYFINAVSNALGGKGGSLDSQGYLMSLVGSGQILLFTIFGLVFQALGWIPFLNCIVGLVVLVAILGVWVLGTYVGFKIIQKTYSLDATKAAAVVVGTGLLYIIGMGILAGIMFAIQMLLGFSLMGSYMTPDLGGF